MMQTLVITNMNSGNLPNTATGPDDGAPKNSSVVGLFVCLFVCLNREKLLPRATVVAIPSGAPARVQFTKRLVPLRPSGEPPNQTVTMQMNSLSINNNLMIVKINNALS